MIFGCTLAHFRGDDCFFKLCGRQNDSWHPCDLKAQLFDIRVNICIQYGKYPATGVQIKSLQMNNIVSYGIASLFLFQLRIWLVISLICNPWSTFTRYACTCCRNTIFSMSCLCWTLLSWIDLLRISTRFYHKLNLIPRRMPISALFMFHVLAGQCHPTLATDKNGEFHHAVLTSQKRLMRNIFYLSGRFLLDGKKTKWLSNPVYFFTSKGFKQGSNHASKLTTQKQINENIKWKCFERRCQN